MKKFKIWLIHLLGGVTVEESKNSGKGIIASVCFSLWLTLSIMLKALTASLPTNGAS